MLIRNELTKSEIRFLEKCLNGEFTLIENNLVIQKNYLVRLLILAGYCVVETQGKITIFKA